MKLIIDRPKSRKDLDMLMELIFTYAFKEQISEYYSSNNQVVLVFRTDDFKELFIKEKENKGL